MNDSQRGAELNPARGIVQRTGRLRRAVFVSVVVAVACIAQGMPSPAATGTPSAPSLVVASQPGPAPEVTVSWDPGAGPAPTGAAVELWSKTASGSWEKQTSTTCYAGCASVAFRYLRFGTAYSAAVFLINAGGTGPASASNVVTLRNTCPVDLCITADSGKLRAPAVRQAGGLLYSMDGTPADAATLAQLKPGMWRGSNGDQPGNPWATATALNIPTTFLLSDVWRAKTNGGQITPWSDWAGYRDWVVWVARQTQAFGIRVDYWEVYNEPDNMNYNYYPPAQGQTVTADLLLTQFLVTYQAIKSVLPNAQIIGPSTSFWIEDSRPWAFSMPQFLDFAAANNLSLAALSWHFNDRVSPQAIEDQVSEARRLIAARPALGNPKIFINEFGIEQTQRIPGWDVQYLAALTAARIDSAGRSCWEGDCFTPVFDGLLAPDRSTLPDFWARVAYAEMTGSMVASAANSDNVGVLASMDADRSHVRLLFGYGLGCIQDPRCASSFPLATLGGSLTTQVTVRVPWRTGHVSVSVMRIPGTSIAAISRPSTRALAPVAIVGTSRGPMVTFNVGPVADGDAWSLTLTPTS